jgi:hypothetical protein
MTRMNRGSLSALLGFVFVFASIGQLGAQETQAATSPASQPAAAASPTDASGATTEQGPSDRAIDDKTVASSPTPPQAAATAPVVKGKKKGEEEYTGPMNVVELPPTPMLDEEGKQRQAPDGKLMFNPPVKQQRDKKGHPLFYEGKPVWQTKDNLGYDENGKKLHAKKEKPPKTVAVSISRGTLTVDGMTGKAALNYEIKDLKFIYIYVPGIGTTVISNDPFPGAVEQKHAFDDKTLTVTVGEHVLQVTSDNRLLGKAPESAYVLVDRSFSAPAKFPVMGYGPIRVAPYAWPGSKVNEEAVKGVVEAPPLPKDLRPTQLLQPCPTGQMRRPSAATLPGQKAAPNPCVPIPTAEANATRANQ